jgi:hypothetical protein
MLSRHSRIAVAEERKKRQEKFRKRTRSLFNKTRLLAKDTDAWVALIVRDRAGRVQSFRSSDSHYWPSSIQDLMVRYSSSPIFYLLTGGKLAHPSGTHEFLEKYAISGCWKEVAGDESDTALEDGDPLFGVIPEEKGPGSDSTISIDHHVYKDIDDGENIPRDNPKETVSERWMVNPLGESYVTPPLQLRESDGTSVNNG